MFIWQGNGLNGHSPPHDSGYAHDSYPRSNGLNGFDDSDSELEEFLDSSDNPEQVRH